MRTILLMLVAFILGFGSAMLWVILTVELRAPFDVKYGMRKHF